MINRIKNRFIVFIFPFLKISSTDYNYTWLDIVPIGWRNKIFIPLCIRIWLALLSCNGFKKYKILDIKEKFGHLRISSMTTKLPYDVNKKIGEIERHYEIKSCIYCIDCGKKSKYRTVGYIRYYCDKCSKNHKNSIKLNSDDKTLIDSMINQK